MSGILTPPSRKPVASAAPTPATATPTTVTFGKITKKGNGEKIILYGTGGIGKTTLACAIEGPVAFFDLDESLDKLLPSLEQKGLSDNVVPVQGITTWQGIRDALHAQQGWDVIKSIVIDTWAVLETFELIWQFDNIKYEGQTVTRLEDYKYKVGQRHIFDTFMLLLSDLDVHARAGRNVILICHDISARAPNTEGQDWIRDEPNIIQDDKNCALRKRVIGWADHVLALRYDVSVSKGKATGSGTRTIYTNELPHYIAKSRTTEGAFPIQVGQEREFWNNIIIK